jgi:threonine synthase
LPTGEVQIPDNIRGLKCVLCGREYSAAEVRYACPTCGRKGILEVIYDFEAVSKRLSKAQLAVNREMSIWRYTGLLPLVEAVPRPGLAVGWTPLYPVYRLGDKLGLTNLYIKDDGRNPTGSLKDRASAVTIVKALELGCEEVTCASTGNAGSSWAASATSTGLKSYIFVPERAPRAKVAQLLVFGATVFAVRGTYDQAYDLCLQATEHFGWYNRNTAYNPYTIEGKKTVALEIAEQLNWEVPDRVIVPVGDGCIVSGVWKGFRDLLSLGFIDRLPQLIAVQAEGSQAIKLALDSGGPIKPVAASTLADSISVCLPANGEMAVRDIRASGGFAVSVSDQEILEAMCLLGENMAIFAEPAAAASVAALRQLAQQGKLERDETIVALVTGSGLKDIDAAISAVDPPQVISPNLEEVIKSLAARDVPSRP